MEYLTRTYNRHPARSRYDRRPQPTAGSPGGLKLHPEDCLHVSVRQGMTLEEVESSLAQQVLRFTITDSHTDMDESYVKIFYRCPRSVKVNYVQGAAQTNAQGILQKPSAAHGSLSISRHHGEAFALYPEGSLTAVAQDLISNGIYIYAFRQPDRRTVSVRIFATPSWRIMREDGSESWSDADCGAAFASAFVKVAKQHLSTEEYDVLRSRAMELLKGH